MFSIENAFEVGWSTIRIAPFAEPTIGAKYSNSPEGAGPQPKESPG